MAEERLSNVILSTNPCPKCKEASESEPMTLKEWRKSEWGMPGSGGRYCKSNCHCILVPVSFLPELPNITKRIREEAEKEISLKAIVDIYPNELLLKELMDEYNARFGKLPQEIYKMRIEDVIAYLEKLLGKEG
jgi:hypothetical protein